MTVVLAVNKLLVPLMTRFTSHMIGMIKKQIRAVKLPYKFSNLKKHWGLILCKWGLKELCILFCLCWLLGRYLCRMAMIWLLFPGQLELRRVTRLKFTSKRMISSLWELKLNISNAIIQQSTCHLRLKVPTNKDHTA